MSFFENTRKPDGIGGKIMVSVMNMDIKHWQTGDFSSLRFQMTERY